MKIFEIFKSKSIKKQILNQSLIFYCFMFILAFLPFKVYFNEIGEVSKTELGFESCDYYYLLIFAALISISLFTFSRLIILISNIISIPFIGIGFVFNILWPNVYAVYGPIAPETKFGYFLMFILVVFYSYRAFKWRKTLNKVDPN